MLNSFTLQVPLSFGPVLAHGLPTTPLTDIFQGTSLPLPLPEMETELRLTPPVVQSQVDLKDWRQLSLHLFRADAIDGERPWHRAVGLHRQRLIWKQLVEQNQTAPAPEPTTEPREAWFEYLTESIDFMTALRRDIESAGIDADQLLKQIRQDRTLRPALAPYERRNHQRFHLLTLQKLLKGEMTFIDPLPFPLLAKLAQLLGQDIRRYITLSNRTLYSERSPLFWTHQDYPIYLETEFDIQVMNGIRSGKQRHQVGSMGWQVWAALKNPENYRSIPDFARHAHLGQGTIRSLIKDNNRPSSKTVERISGVLPDSLKLTLIRAHNDSYFAELAAKLNEEALYPGQTIFIGRRPEDEKKLRRILQYPSRPLRFLLGARNLYPDLPGVVEMARELGLQSAQLTGMEMGTIPVLTETLAAWQGVSDCFKIPVELLQIGAAIEYGIAEDDRAWAQAAKVPRKRRSGRLPDKKRGSRNHQAPPEAKTDPDPEIDLTAMTQEELSKFTKTELPTDRPGQKIFLSTLERSVLVARRRQENGRLELVYGRDYVGRLDRESIVDGEFLSEITIINQVRDPSEPATLEIQLAWPQHISEPRLALLRQQAAQVAAKSPGIRQIVLLWHPMIDSVKPANEQSRLVLYPEA